MQKFIVKRIARSLILVCYLNYGGLSDVNYSITISMYCCSSIYSDCEEIMNYIIKGFLILEDKQLDCRFEFILPDIENVIEVLSKCYLSEAYDVIKIYPFNKEV